MFVKELKKRMGGSLKSSPDSGGRIPDDIPGQGDDGAVGIP